VATNHKLSFEQAKRAVVKVGSNVLTADNGLNLKAMGSIARQICKLIDNGLEVILVSSGAMASGVKKIGLAQRPDELPKRQAVAAIGQAGLMMEYEKVFGRYKQKVAQILLTSEDLSSRKRYLNARNTLNTLLSWKVVPIVNENDTVWVEEIKLGDNDNLAAMITLLMDADVLINLTDIDGLYTQDPRVHPDAELIARVTRMKTPMGPLSGWTLRFAFSSRRMVKAARSSPLESGCCVMMFLLMVLRKSLQRQNAVGLMDRGVSADDVGRDFQQRQRLDGPSLQS